LPSNSDEESKRAERAPSHFQQSIAGLLGEAQRLPQLKYKITALLEVYRLLLRGPLSSQICTPALLAIFVDLA
jgi:hypothetical protein